MHLDLPLHLAAALQALPPGPLRLAFSGGLDSTALLHALATLPGARHRDLRAIHVDHGLHADSTRWAEHCMASAVTLQVPCVVLRVSVQRAGKGLEAAARESRYAMFAAQLPPHGVLALAHHQDDQSETVLLKLLRGAGPEGIAGMRTLRPFAAGHLWRPLLDVPRSTLRAYAQAHRLAWIDDPSNDDARLSRNFLRQEVLPRLRTHWSHLDDSLAHAAQHARAAADFIDSAAEKALSLIQGFDAATLHWNPWLDLPDALRDPVLRRWLRGLQLDEPTHLHVAELERQLREADSERLPCIAFGRSELRRYRDLVYARSQHADPPADWQQTWDGSPLQLPADCGHVSLIDAAEADAKPANQHLVPVRTTLRFRRRGETLRPVGSPHTRELRDLFQQAGVPPWERARVPVLCDGDSGELLAVGDLWLSQAGATWLEQRGLRFQWLQASACAGVEQGA